MTLRPIQRSSSSILAALVVPWLVACAPEPQDDASAAETTVAETAAMGDAETDAEAAAASGSAEGAEHAGEGGEAGEHGEGEGGEHGRSEHGDGEHGDSEHDGGEHGEEGEESGVYIGQSDTWDATRRGARLVLSFDRWTAHPEASAFQAGSGFSEGR